MLLRDHALAALVLAIIATIGIIVLAALGDPIPDTLTGLAVGGLAGGTGLAIPTRGAPVTSVASAPPATTSA